MPVLTLTPAVSTTLQLAPLQVGYAYPSSTTYPSNGTYPGSLDLTLTGASSSGLTLAPA